MLWKRSKRNQSSAADLQQLKQEIRSELSRLRPYAGERQSREPSSPRQQPPGRRRPPSVTATPTIQRQALAQLHDVGRQSARSESASAANVQTLAAPDASLPDTVRRQELAIERLSADVRRLAGEVARVAGEKHQSRGVGQVANEPAPPTEPSEQRFAAGTPAVNVSVAAVPNFQRLMDLQRALDSLPSVQTASVVEFERGNASLSLTLGRSASLREIMSNLRAELGGSLVVEESWPETARLRLRFISSCLG